MADSGGMETDGASRLGEAAHRLWLADQAARQIGFFRSSLRSDGGFDVLDVDGTPLPRTAQELHTTTRLTHSFALAKAAGARGCDAIIDAGMTFLWDRHRDPVHGGYGWSASTQGVADGTRLAYGHVFVLLAGASARQAGHPHADRLIADVVAIIDGHFWDEAHGLLRDEFAPDWTPFSTYRGMNANMHGVEAMLAAFEATGEALHLERAGRILDFFTARMAPENGWRLPEHYTEAWEVDWAYQGNPMFRPAGTTPGHSLELGRLLLQWWALSGRPAGDAPARARRLIERALADAWREDGGLVYTLDPDGRPAVRDRYWWPVAEAIGAMAALLKLDPRPSDEDWYQRLWRFADRHFIDHARGGWFPEIDEQGAPVARQFNGKPDLYHSLQAALLPLAPGIARPFEGLRETKPLG
ncbi:AGE family epimerase/isomerase [Aquibium carbonis]|uniref:AGE family epimerase/isomerase n=1 Tax=Aquibium carbonis TaxID=2495581 RepID=A0A3S0AQ97_9HYPH|nr:AGE family epimerase/isomerase [Aquibium carbonis]RST84552.1 AGE family epimerase/isomerase [Aquibium carbonis]